MKRRVSLGGVVAITWLGLMYLCVLGPAVVVIVGSFNTATSFPSEFKGFTLGWYAQLAEHGEFLDALVVSVEIGAIAAFIGSVLGIPVSLALARYEFRFKGVVTAFVTAPLVLPQIVLGLAMLQLLSAVRVPATFLGLALIHKEIQSRLGITTVFVTHDQEEALTISDRIAVMHAGRVIQEGSPVEIFERPQHSFVAGFIGQSNLLRGVFAGTLDGRAALRTERGAELHGRTIRPIEPGTPAIAVIRHSRVRIRPADDSDRNQPNQHDGRIELVNYLGESIQYVCTVGGTERIIASAAIAAARALPMEAGTEIAVSWQTEDCLLIEDASRLDSDDG